MIKNDNFGHVNKLYSRKSDHGIPTRAHRSKLNIIFNKGPSTLNPDPILGHDNPTFQELGTRYYEIKAPRQPNYQDRGGDRG